MVLLVLMQHLLYLLSIIVIILLMLYLILCFALGFHHLYQMPYREFPIKLQIQSYLSQSIQIHSNSC